jgi:hypothetical protein
MKILISTLLILAINSIALAQDNDRHQRWDVKTRMDTVRLHAKLDSTSVIFQRNLPKPKWSRKNGWAKLPRREDEKDTLTLCGFVVKIGIEPDGDYHLVIADTCCMDSTMTIEIPDPADCTSSFMEYYRKARLMANMLWRQPKSKGHLRRVIPKKVRIKGLGFWDKIHGPRSNDHAPNGREIHPVLEVRPCE